MPKFALIYNPRAKRNRKFPWRMYRYRSITQQVGTFILSENLEHLDEIIADLKRKEYDLIGVCGGDGSIQKTLTTVLKQWGSNPLPTFVPVKGGTMNTVVTALGIRGMGRSYLRAIVKHVRDNNPIRTTERPMLKVNQEYAFMFGLGLPSRLMSVYYAGGGGARNVVKIIGRGAASVVAGSDFARWIADPFQTEIRWEDGSTTRESCTAILAGTIDRYPLGFKLMPRATEKDGHFQLRWTTFPLSGFLVNLHRFHRGLPILDPRFHDRLTTSAEIHTQQECEIILDGEIDRIGKGLRLETGPSLRFALP